MSSLASWVMTAGIIEEALQIEADMSDIFMSYVQQDSAVAEEIAGASS